MPDAGGGWARLDATAQAANACSYQSSHCATGSGSSWIAASGSNACAVSLKSPPTPRPGPREPGATRGDAVAERECIPPEGRAGARR